jgi:hypothetical protein
MTVRMTLSPELAERLQHAAEQEGLSVDAYAVRLLEQHLPQRERARQAIALLQSWIDADDEEEQKETGDMLIRTLDEDRPSNRKLFPEELKGISW